MSSIGGILIFGANVTTMVNESNIESKEEKAISATSHMNTLHNFLLIVSLSLYLLIVCFCVGTEFENDNYWSLQGATESSYLLTREMTPFHTTEKNIAAKSGSFERSTRIFKTYASMLEIMNGLVMKICRNNEVVTRILNDLETIKSISGTMYGSDICSKCMSIS